MLVVNLSTNPLILWAENSKYCHNKAISIKTNFGTHFLFSKQLCDNTAILSTSTDFFIILLKYLIVQILPTFDNFIEITHSSNVAYNISSNQLYFIPLYIM